MNRDEFFKRQGRAALELKQLATIDLDAYDRFMHLAISLYDAFAAHEIQMHRVIKWREGFTGDWSPRRKEFGADYGALIEGCEVWQLELFDLCERNPAFELAEIMRDISEIDALEWPYHYEADIQTWVDGDRIQKPHFVLCSWSTLRDAHMRLRELRSTLNGWVCVDQSGSPAFKTEDEWQKVRGDYNRPQGRWLSVR